MPKARTLTFYLDDSIAYGVEMSKKIDDVISADLEAEKHAGVQTGVYKDEL